MNFIAAEHRVKVLHQALTLAECGGSQAVGMEFGKACYELRAKYSNQGRRKDLVPSGTKLTFVEFCDREKIARRTAYRWIEKYEILIGVRPDPTNVVPELDAASGGIPRVSNGVESARISGFNSAVYQDEKQRVAGLSKGPFKIEGFKQDMKTGVFREFVVSYKEVFSTEKDALEVLNRLKAARRK